MTPRTLDGRRHLLPRWASTHAAIVERCRFDVDFRLLVLSAEGWERAILTNDARRWMAAREQLQ